MFLQSSDEFDGFDGASLLLLVAGGIAAVLWAMLAVSVWFATRPRKPSPGPVTSELHAETPALANFLTNGWRLSSIAMTATLVDLAARRFLALEDYAGDRHVVRVRSSAPDDSGLTNYEKQVLDLVKSRATNGSAPVESLDLGEESQAERWWNSFRKRVHQAAKEQGLARPRWRSRDVVLTGLGLLVVLELFALALGVAGLGSSSNSSEDLDWWEWMIGAAIAWFAAIGWFLKNEALRETAAGRDACARWLGTKQFFRESNAFGEATPGSVAAWERNLAYATAFGLAHGIDRALPLAPDDPESAWSRRGGEWHQVSISYPKRFGWGQPPFTIFLQGLGLTALFGFVGFLLLPFIAGAAWDFWQDILDEENVEIGSGAQFGIVTAFIAVLSLGGIYILIQLTNGLIRLYRGGLDLGKSITVEGPVINQYQGRIAIDDGDDETCAWFPPAGQSAGGRGSVVRIERTPRLWHIRKLEVLSRAGAQEVEDVEIADMEAVAASIAAGPFGRFTEADIASIAGVALPEVSEQGSRSLSRRFRSEAGQISVTASPTGSAKVVTLVGMFMSIASRGESLALGDIKTTWAGDRVLMAQGDQHLLTVDVDLPGKSTDERREIAERVARLTMPAAGTG